jgi:hypothetical protein
MKKLLLLFVLFVGTSFPFWGPEPEPETLGSRIKKKFSAQELYKIMQWELELYVNDKASYPFKTQWYTHPVLYSVLKEYTIEKETHSFNKTFKSGGRYVEGNKIYGETLEERIQRTLEKDDRTVEDLIRKTMGMINMITPEVNTKDLISYIEKHAIYKELYKESFFYSIKTLQSKLYGDRETYIQNLLTLYTGNGSFADVYGYRTVELFAESGDPRCVEKLELAAKMERHYGIELEIGKFLVANGGEITEDVLEKALDYSHSRVRLWGAIKISEMKIKRLYPKLRDLYNQVLMAGRSETDISMALYNIEEFPYEIPPDGKPIPEDALPLEGERRNIREYDD